MSSFKDPSYTTTEIITGLKEGVMPARILIVDDHDDFRLMLKNYLNSQKLGVELYEASSGEMALTKAACINPDIVLMDISLPHSNGIVAAKHIKEDHPDCDIIILTMFDVKAFKKASQKIHARSFIGKNELYDRLVPAIKKCLKGKGQKL